jgi:hypothetical protein
MLVKNELEGTRQGESGRDVVLRSVHCICLMELRKSVGETAYFSLEFCGLGCKNPVCLL